MGDPGRQAPEQGQVLGAPGLLGQTALRGFRLLALGDGVAEGFVGHVKSHGVFLDVLCERHGGVLERFFGFFALRDIVEHDG